MKKSFLLLLISVLLLIPKCAFANDLNIGAKAAIVIDIDNCEIIFDKNAFTALPPASTTKILTAITVIEAMPLDAICSVSAKAEAVDEASIYLTCGQSFTVLDLLYAAMLKSANDACYCLAENFAGSEEFFVKLLNWKAFAIGANSAILKNTNGLPHPEHKMSAYDLAVISRYAMNNPVFAEICKTKNVYLSDGRYIKNINKLLHYDESYIGIKTGTTNEAGPCLVSAQKKENKSYIAVVLNSPDRYSECIKLLNSAFTIK